MPSLSDQLPKYSSDFVAKLQKWNPKYDEELASYSTWKIGGPADILIRVPNSQELEEIVQLCFEYQVPYNVLGRASNILISDKGVEGVVIINKSRNVNILEAKND